jgi:hypothetical protein
LYCITMSSVWVQVYYKGETNPAEDGEPFKIETNLRNVNDLKKKVKEDNSSKLKHVDAGDLKVYAPGTDVTNLDATEALNSWGNVPAGSTGPCPLIVIAPKPEQQNGKLRCLLFSYSCIQILL